MSDIYISETGQYGLGSEILVKIGSRFPNPNDWRHYVSFRHCQVIDIAPIGTYKESGNERKNMCVIELPNVAYWSIRGSYDIKDETEGAEYLLNFITSNEEINGKLKRREWLIDVDWLYTQQYITTGQWESIYDKSRPHDRISLPAVFDFQEIIKYEPEWDRENLVTDMQPGSISSGTYSIGSGLNYATLAAFEADLAATLTGNLNGQHNDEETALSGTVTFDVQTNAYRLTIEAQSGDKHKGIFGNATHAAGDGARINYGTSSIIAIDEVTAGYTKNVTIKDLVLDSRGSLNIGINAVDGGDSGEIIIDSNIVRCDSGQYYGISSAAACPCTIRNNIVYDATNGVYGAGITFVNGNKVYNNSVDNCRIGIYVSGAGTASTVRNNLSFGCTYDYYALYGATYWGTTSKNVSEDATSPNTSYRNISVVSNSVFVNYASDNFLLDPNGNATNLAVLDDGDDLSGTFTDDITDRGRITWYIGASELVYLVSINGTSAGAATATATIEAKQFSNTEGSASGTATASSTITAVSNTQGQANGQATASGTINATASTSGSASGQATASGTITAIKSITGTSSGSSTASCSITALRNANGSASGSASASGQLNAVANISGTSSGQATASCQICAVTLISGSASGQATVSSEIKAISNTAGTSSGQSTASGQLNAIATFNGTAAGIATATCTISTSATADTTGFAQGTSTASATICACANFTGSTSGTSTCQSTIIAVFNCTGTVDGSCTVTSNISGIAQFNGTADGVSTATCIIRDGNVTAGFSIFDSPVFNSQVFGLTGVR